MYDKGICAAATYHFFHANIFHLISNSIALFFILRIKRLNWKLMIVAYVIASLAFFTATTPTIGMSNFVYASIGLLVPPLYSKWWTTRTSIIFFMSILLSFAIPNVSAITHLVSFCAGAALSMTHYALKQSKLDYGKAKERR